MSHFENVMEELRALYLEETLRRAAAMNRTLDQLETDPAAGTALNELVVHFHGLAGTGTSYGFAELSLLGRLGEHDSGIRLRMGETCAPEDFRTWRALVAQIEGAALSHACKTYYVMGAAA